MSREAKGGASDAAGLAGVTRWLSEVRLDTGTAALSLSKGDAEVVSVGTGVTGTGCCGKAEVTVGIWSVI